MYILSALIFRTGSFTDMADILYTAMMGFYALLALVSSVVMCRLPGMIKAFDAEVAKNNLSA